MYTYAHARFQSRMVVAVLLRRCKPHSNRQPLPRAQLPRTSRLPRRTRLLRMGQRRIPVRTEQVRRSGTKTLCAHIAPTACLSAKPFTKDNYSHYMKFKTIISHMCLFLEYSAIVFLCIESIDNNCFYISHLFFDIMLITAILAFHFSNKYFWSRIVRKRTLLTLESFALITFIVVKSISYIN